MRFPSFFTAALRWLVLAAFLSAGYAMAQQEPTMNQIYSTAQAGKLDQAQVMIQQVLVAHPNSAKAHYVQAELFARQGNLTKARESLATAEKLAPGLPFAKPESVQELKDQLAARVAKPQQLSAVPTSAAPQQPSNSWLLPAVLAGGVIVVAYFVFRRRTPQVIEQPAMYNGGLSGPQTFGSPGMQPAYGPTGYPQQAYGQPAGTGLGGRIMGGVATGLAVGAGVVAAEAIGRSIMGNHESGSQGSTGYVGNYEPVSSNADMGGQNFGVSDTSWEDSTLADSGSDSSDWDS